MEINLYYCKLMSQLVVFMEINWTHYLGYLEKGFK